MNLDFSRITQQKNVYYLTPEDANFSKHYLAVRKKEDRILTDNEVRKLPFLHRDEWPYRIQSTERFIKYVSEKSQAQCILTLGCGNGWFSNKIATISSKNEIIGLDINRKELEQAARVFHKENLRFVYADIFKITSFFQEQFDIITLNGVVQYFSDFQELFSLLQSFLKKNGEIHIMDSPFYKTSEILDAKRRTLEYYTELNVPEMSNHYHHHDQKLVEKFDTLYSYKKNIIHKILRKKDSPFSWYRWTKQ
ncbi:class I SAM-dependent methyltransferase [Kordia zhangzhouensis]|uniref:class I SAM-dependent methyltransferase n=1 Tax=Kordia zhangzhouensis TaxID=1620405 RepID=UPI00069A2882|nr:class I SAM-dependent methyltransferase [Kordia zhangzhouensis]